tara:strand:+ start:341 stop:475 length:135 start_codon:yes stop_codon:yes gene_type:complete
MISGVDSGVISGVDSIRRELWMIGISFLVDYYIIIKKNDFNFEN